ncbi:MAG: hypothetical protein B6I18_09355, partial [Bacteroidetes bacterium 4572_112]
KDASLVSEASNIKTYRTKTFELYSLYTSLKKNKEIPYGGFSNEQEPNFVQKAARFVRGNFFIPDPRKGWNKYAIAKAKELIEEHNIEVIITTSPPHSTQLIGLSLKKQFPNIKWIADLRDPWTDIHFYDKFYPTKLARSIDSKFERQVVENSDITISVSKGIQRTMQNRYPNSEIKVLTNGYDHTDFGDDLFNNKVKNRELIYTGTLTADYPLQEIIDLSKSNTDLKFRFIGNHPREFRELVEKDGLADRFTFQKFIPHSEITAEMINAGILLVLVPKVLHNEGLPSGKIYEYIGAKSPILAIGPENSDIEAILTETNSGIYFSYDNVKNISKLDIENLYKIQTNNKSEEYSRRNITKKLVDLIN